MSTMKYPDGTPVPDEHFQNDYAPKQPRDYWPQEEFDAWDRRVQEQKARVGGKVSSGGAKAAADQTSQLPPVPRRD
jgi:hypothetical protein